jgi:hypothetical protein
MVVALLSENGGEPRSTGTRTVRRQRIRSNPLTRGVLSGGLSRVRRASRWCAVSIASSTTRA